MCNKGVYYYMFVYYDTFVKVKLMMIQDYSSFIVLQLNNKCAIPVNVSNM